MKQVAKKPVQKVAKQPQEKSSGRSHENNPEELELNKDNNKPDTLPENGKINIRGDGNCAIRAVLVAANIDQDLHMDLRWKLANAINSLEGEDRVILLGVADPQKNEDDETSISRYIEEFKRHWTFLKTYELKILAKKAGFGLDIEITDRDFIGNRIQTINEETPKIKLLFNQGFRGTKGEYEYGHYDLNGVKA